MPVVLAVLAFAPVARAGTAESHPDGATEPPPAAQQPLPPGTHRARPDYDGRARVRPSVGQDLLWIPRVLLYPLYLVTEYGIRQPIGWVTTNLERSRVVDRLNFLAHPNGNVSIVPTVAVDLSLVASVGLHMTWQNALVRRNLIHVLGATGGPGYWLARLSDRYEIGPRSGFGIEGEYYERSDWRYYGLGPDTNTEVFSSFNWARTDVHGFLEYAAMHHWGFALTMGARYDHFGPSFAVPLRQQSIPGYDDHGEVYGTAHAFLDSRHIDEPNQTGARIEASVNGASDLHPTNERRWIGYEAEGSLFLEVKHPGRVLGVSAYAVGVHPLSQAPVPFVDLATVGGWEHMRAFFYGRFRGESATVFTVNYRYPVWWWLDGDVFFEAGNAWNANFGGFDVRHLFGSFGLGFRTIGNRDVSFDAVLAFGTTRFDERFDINAVRVALGVNRGF